MKQQAKVFSLKALCSVLGVSKSGYFEWLGRLPSARTLSNQRLVQKIQEQHQKSRQTYGYRRIYAELKEQGLACSPNRVARLMKTHQIRPKTVRPFKATTDSKHTRPLSDNLLNRQFRPQGPNQRWVGDITFIPTQEGWLYLATVLDLYSRKIIGWSLGHRITAQLVCNGLKMALGNRCLKRTQQLLWHSDRGSQYAATEYQALLTKHGIQGSMSRKGNCWDNSVAESFFSTLKKELIHHEKYMTRSHAEAQIFEYIEVFYNRQRRHSTLGYLSPVEYEKINLVA